MFLSMDNIGRLIEDRRKYLGLTQRQLAGMSGCGLRFIGEVENGKKTCQIAKVLDVLKALDIKMKFVITL